MADTGPAIGGWTDRGSRDQTPVVERFASFDGVELAYSVTGTGPDVLLLHGFASDALGNWIRPGIHDAIVKSGRRVIAYDARGHGASDKPHDPAAYENDAMVRDAQALLDRLGIERVDVVGYSMGSMVSTRLVPQEPRARSLVLGGIGGRARRGRDPERRARIASALEAGEEARAEDAEARAFRRFAERSGNDLEALAAIQRAPLSARPGLLASIAVPTLVVAGDEDQLAGSPEELAEHIPDGVGRVVPGNHLSAVGKPELTAAIVDFLARVSPV
jgi:pimeloyl-ACP methyl ester carboxylesterase